jgi:hypothetical protein
MTLTISLVPISRHERSLHLSSFLYLSMHCSSFPSRVMIVLTEDLGTQADGQPERHSGTLNT